MSNLGKGGVSRYYCGIKLIQLISFLRVPRTYMDIKQRFNCSRKTATRMMMALTYELNAPIIEEYIAFNDREKDERVANRGCWQYRLPKEWIRDMFA